MKFKQNKNAKNSKNCSSGRFVCHRWISIGVSYKRKYINLVCDFK